MYKRQALNVITEVIRRKRDQILSSVFIIVMLIIASSLCMYSLEHEAQPEVFKNVIMLLDNHVKCGIEIDISSYEKPMRFRLVRPGSNWYTAGRTVECILEDMRSITFKIITPENKYYDEVVDISEIPFREGKTTRVSVSVSFTDSDRCNITIKDLGFGEFVKSSGKVISKELVLRS